MYSQKSKSFVDYILEMIHGKRQKGFGAKLKKADNESTEYQSWEILSQWIDLENPRERKAYGLIGASAARSKQATDGSLGLGRALYLIYKKDGGDGELEKSSAAARLRRLLACRDTLELIEVIRPLLRYIESNDISLNRAQLLDDIIRFQYDSSREWIRTRWAQEGLSTLYRTIF